MAEFRFELTVEEKSYCKGLVRESIRTRLAGEDPEVPPPPTAKLRESFGAFVTLSIGGDLRGCIGNVQGSGPLYLTIWNMARAAAFEDPRFPELTETEFARIETEVSILSPVEVCPDPARIEVGRHGLIMMRGGRSGLLLPQVPVEWGWDRETFLSQTCLKAGLPPQAWKDPDTAILWFEAEVF